MDAFSLFLSALIVFELFADIYLSKKCKHNLFIIDIVFYTQSHIEHCVFDQQRKLNAYH